jgi:L-fucose isomerase-like protein
MHVYTGEAKTPPTWEEFGWERPAPQLSSLEVFPDSCSVEEFSQKVCSQHVIISYGDYREELKYFCSLLGIEMI